MTVGPYGRMASILIIILLLLSIVTPYPVVTASSGTTPTVVQPYATTRLNGQTANNTVNITTAQRTAAAAEFKEAVASVNSGGAIMATPTMDPGGVPHYFGPYANYANSPMPKGAIFNITLVDGGSGYTNPVVNITDAYYTGSGANATATFNATTGAITGIILVTGGHNYTAPIVTIMDPTGTGAVATPSLSGSALTGGIRKFVDSLPGVGAANANDLGQYIPQAIPNTTAYPGSDYYVIELGQYTEKLHKDLPATTLRGYRQVNTNDVNVSKFSYLGPLIVAQKDRPVRVKFINNLSTGTGGNLFLPVDTTIMGAGMGPLGMNATPMNYTQNRGTIHLHGGNTPWISDGTADQWTTPAGEHTSYPEGVSVYNVPDMDNGTEPQGTLTFYYTNNQSARLMFYHDHSLGITRLNVYAGEVGPYILNDQVERDMIAGTNVTGVNPNHDQVIPDNGTPLIIQDKTFVDNTTIAAQDPTWNSGTTKPTPHTGDLWFPHVYMTNQNPYDVTGANPFGRWDYGPWFWPPTQDLTYGPKPNPYYDPINAPWEPPLIPATPNPSDVMEAFMDTPIVNGAAYPNLTVDPKAYRFRILDGADDRYLNLQLYVADPNVTTADGRNNTEVKMVPACPDAGFPANWPTDGRPGGVPDPTTQGPPFIQIGTEGGFLPAPVVVPDQPITYNNNPKTFNFGNVKDHALLIGPAERADVIVDFSQYAGKTLILYNDAPAAFPAFDPRNDYYTNDSDLTGSGGAPVTQPGYGPNIRTIMQIKVAATRSDGHPIVAYNLSALQAVFAKTAGKNGVFEVSQPPIIVAQSGYNSAYNGSFSSNAYVRIQDTSMDFRTISGKAMHIVFEQKSIHDEMGAAYDQVYGRAMGLLGLELPNTTAQTQNILLYPYASPPTDIVVDSVNISEPVAGDGTQIWKITHNGIDTHVIHVHLFNVQVINRVAWDGSIMPPDPNELGWKETVRVNPLETTIIALRPVAPPTPFEVPNSVREIDPTMPDGAILAGPPGGFTDVAGNGVTVVNHLVNFGWEHVWHCHMLSHEEMDMMHALVFVVAPRAPTNLTATPVSTGLRLNWTDNSRTETGFIIQRANDSNFTSALVSFTVGPNVTTYTDTTVNRTNPFYYYRVQATNTVGDMTVYPAPAVGFPQKTASSAYTNTAPYMLSLNAQYVSDTIPGTMVAVQAYPVSITMKNTGSTNWTAAGAIMLGAVGDNSGDGARFDGIRMYIAPGVVVQTGETYTFSFTMTAPATAATYHPAYQMVWEFHQWFGSTLTKTVNVVPITPNAAVVSDTIPATMISGNSYNVSVTMRNTGNINWTAANQFRLGAVGDYTGNAALFDGVRMNISPGVVVRNGETYTFSFTMTAPASGTYSPAYQMVWEFHQWFGSTLTKTVRVIPATPNAAVVSDTIPTTMVAGRSYNVSVTMINTGNLNWTQSSMVRLGAVGDYSGDAILFDGVRVNITPGVVVHNGEAYTFSFTMTAPASGTYHPAYQMVWENHQWFGSTLIKTVTVTSAMQQFAATMVSNTIPSTMVAGRSYPASVTVRNTGSRNWTAADGIQLAGIGNQTGHAALMGVYRFSLANGVTVHTGELYTFNFTMTAPAAGSYTPGYRMYWNGHYWFGDPLLTTIRVR